VIDRSAMAIAHGALFSNHNTVIVANHAATRALEAHTGRCPVNPKINGG